MLANDINHLIDLLNDIIEEEQKNGSPLGYFPALYRKVTIEVRDKIKEGYFDNGARMERLDVGFANRYLEAYYNYKEGKPITKSWQLAFTATEDSRPIVLQHLFLGMSAHINLDLGIVASEISPGDQIQNLKGDFDKINEVLGSLVNQVEKELGQIWKAFKFIDRIAGGLDEALADFGIDIARIGAWKVATDLATIEAQADKATYISNLDERVYKFGCRLYKPGIITNLVLRLIRFSEKGNVAERIQILR